MTALMMTCAEEEEPEHIAVVMQLTQANVDVNCAQPETGFTALMHAAASGNIGIVEVLLESRADPHLVDTVTNATTFNMFHD